MAAQVPSQVVGIIRISADGSPRQLAPRHSLNVLTESRFSWSAQGSRNRIFADSTQLRRELAELLEASH